MLTPGIAQAIGYDKYEKLIDTGDLEGKRLEFPHFDFFGTNSSVVTISILNDIGIKDFNGEDGSGGCGKEHTGSGFGAVPQKHKKARNANYVSSFEKIFVSSKKAYKYYERASSAPTAPLPRYFSQLFSVIFCIEC